MFAAACASGCVAFVRLMLASNRGGDVHENEERALAKACKNGRIDVVHELISLRGPRAPDFGARDFISLAVENGHADVARLLAPFCALTNYAYYTVCADGDADLLRTLLNTCIRDADVPLEESGAFVAGSSSLEVVRFLLSQPPEDDAERARGIEWGFKQACEDGCVAVAKELMSATNVNVLTAAFPGQGNRSLRRFYRDGEGFIQFEYLYAQDSDDDPSAEEATAAAAAVAMEPWCHIQGRQTAFECACQNGHLDIVRLLLEVAREVPDAAALMCLNDAFHAACLYGHVHVVRALLALDGPLRVDIHYRNGVAMTAAHAFHQDAIVMELLNAQQ